MNFKAEELEAMHLGLTKQNFIHAVPGAERAVTTHQWASGAITVKMSPQCPVVIKKANWMLASIRRAIQKQYRENHYADRQFYGAPASWMVCVFLVSPPQQRCSKAVKGSEKGDKNDQSYGTAYEEWLFSLAFFSLERNYLVGGYYYSW